MRSVRAALTAFGCDIEREISRELGERER